MTFILLILVTLIIFVLSAMLADYLLDRYALHKARTTRADWYPESIHLNGYSFTDLRSLTPSQCKCFLEENLTQRTS